MWGVFMCHEGEKWQVYKWSHEIKSGCLTPSGLQWWYVKSYQSHPQACLPTFHCTWYASNPTNLCHYKDTMPSVILVALLHCDMPKKQAHREGGYFPEHLGLLTLSPFWAASSRSLLHCLHSMSKRLGKIISNAFTVHRQTLWRACKHVERMLLINSHAC